jgi:hypothetical protein
MSGHRLDKLAKEDEKVVNIEAKARRLLQPGRKLQHA